MNKSELLEYLRAVCDGENALYACNEAISTINNELNNLKRNAPVKPDEPPAWVGDDRFYSYRKTTGHGSFTGAIVGAVLGFIIGLLCVAPTLNGALPFIGIPVGAVIGAIVGWLMEEGTIHSEQTEKRNIAYDEYQKRELDYKKAISIYDKAVMVDKAVEKKLVEMIEENEVVADRIRGELDKLYARNIIHGTFRNMIAVNQILEYLEMGVCEELTGANGAYAQYLLDVRTDRICHSIDSLKEAMRSMMGQMIFVQGQILGEMQKTNMNMGKLQGALRNEMAGIKEQVMLARETAMQTNIRLDSTNQYLQAANSKIGQMNNILSASAHNQYIAMRESGMNNYMLRNPDIQ